MKHLIKDIELMDYLEDRLSKSEKIVLKKRLAENGELDVLYHLQLAYEAGCKAKAEQLIGEDDFMTSIGRTESLNSLPRMAADVSFEEKKDDNE